MDDLDAMLDSLEAAEVAKSPSLKRPTEDKPQMTPLSSVDKSPTRPPSLGVSTSAASHPAISLIDIEPIDLECIDESIKSMLPVNRHPDDPYLSPSAEATTDADVASPSTADNHLIDMIDCSLIDAPTITPIALPSPVIEQPPSLLDSSVPLFVTASNVQIAPALLPSPSPDSQVHFMLEPDGQVQPTSQEEKEYGVDSFADELSITIVSDAVEQIIDIANVQSNERFEDCNRRTDTESPIAPPPVLVVELEPIAEPNHRPLTPLAADLRLSADLEQLLDGYGSEEEENVAIPPIAERPIDVEAVEGSIPESSPPTVPDPDNHVQPSEEEDELVVEVAEEAPTSSAATHGVGVGHLIASEHQLTDMWNWRLTESERQLGKVKPYWIPDVDTLQCMLCDKKFSMLRRRHHCRSCGRVLCRYCCDQYVQLAYLSDHVGRVCVPCRRTLERIIECEIEEARVQLEELQNTPQTPTNQQSSSANPTNQRQDGDNVGHPSSPPPPYEEVEQPATAEEAGTSTGDNPPATLGKSVRFGDGVRPGESTSPAAEVATGGRQRSGGRRRHTRSGHRLAALRLQLELTSYLPDLASIAQFDVDHPSPSLADILSLCARDGRQVFLDGHRQEVPSEAWMEERLRAAEEGGVDYVVKRNLLAKMKIVEINGADYWSIASLGMFNVAAAEIVITVDLSMNPMHVLVLFDWLYQYALKGSRHSEMETVNFKDVMNNHLISADPDDVMGAANDKLVLFGDAYDSLILVNQSRQSIDYAKTILPPDGQSYFYGLLVLKCETQLAKALPLRLLCRLGHMTDVYPWPLHNVAGRAPTYTDLSQTMLNVFIDFAHLSYTLSALRGATMTMFSDGRCVLAIPTACKEKLSKLLDACSNGLLAFAVDTNIRSVRVPSDCPVDAHLVYVLEEAVEDPTNEQPAGTSPTIHSTNQRSPRARTHVFPERQGEQTAMEATFVVINGSLQTSSGAHVQCTVIEDGVMIRARADSLESLIEAMRGGREITIKGEGESCLQLKWISNDVLAERIHAARGKQYSTVEATYGQPLGIHRRLCIMHNMTTSTNIPTMEWALRLAQTTIISHATSAPFEHWSMQLWSLGKAIECQLAGTLLPFMEGMLRGGWRTIHLKISISSESAEYEVGEWPPSIAEVYDTWTSTLDDALVALLFDTSSKMSQSSKFDVEYMFTVIDYV